MSSDSPSWDVPISQSIATARALGGEGEEEEEVEEEEGGEGWIGVGWTW